MEPRIEDDVEGWPTRPIEGGFAGLRELASADFSGAVRARGATMFVLNGRIVGVFDGTVEDFEDADGTAHKAPHRSLPLLYAMQESGGETRAKYYTNDTPISQVDQTLSEGGFTGYIELSENVLSGDYYVVYHGGRAMSLAFVGNSERLVTDDEAFELADDEVGIYEVNDVEIDVRDVPGLDGGGGGAAAGAGGGASSSDGTGSDAAPAPDHGQQSADDPGAPAESGAGGGSTADAAGGLDDAPAGAGTGAGESTGSTAESDAAGGSAGDPPGTDAGADPSRENRTAGVADAAADEFDEGGTEPDRDPGTGPADDAADPIRDAEPDRSPPSDDPGGDPARESDAVAGDATAAADDGGSVVDDRTDGDAGTARSRTEEGGSAGQPEPDPGSSADPVAGAGREQSGVSARGDEPGGVARTGVADEGAEVLEEEPAGTDEDAWREATTIPSLDPDRTADEPPVPTTTSSGSRGGAGGTATREQSTASQPAIQQAGQQRSRPTPQSGDVEDTFEQEVLEREDHIDRLQQRVSNLEAERDDLARERDRLAEEVEELDDENETLRAEIRRLERDLDELEAETGAGDTGASAVPDTDAGGAQDLDPLTALEGTDLFVRYDSKGEATLEDVQGAAVDAGDVNDNLRVDLHTRFDADESTVAGEPFREFLEDTMGYRFVEWLVRALPFEIRNTGQQSALRDLYDALPEIDRVEFDGTVELAYEDAGEEVREVETFDVVVRDRMGEPLVVANLNDSRDPATERMIVDLHEAASRVKNNNAALVGAFFVTRSFFDPEALETASEATSGSLLSRDSRRSYVKLSRKQGYHLCLVEARGDDLHLNQPEL